MSLPNLGLQGPAGSGKDTAARILVERYGYHRRALADPLKQDVAAILLERDHIPEPEAVAWVDAHKADLRELLQGYGQARRAISGADYWLNLFEQRLKQDAPRSPVVVPDVRLPNEVTHLRRRGFLIVELVPTYQLHKGVWRAHVTETSMTRQPDFYLLNRGAPEDLEQEIAAFLKELLP